MGKFIDLTGQKFGRLTVVKVLPISTKSNGKIYLCKCDCGNEKNISSFNLRITGTKSCGCIVKENGFFRFFKDGRQVNNRKEYITWIDMKSRCLNPNEKYYHRYGGRGIKICDRWLNDFNNFLLDVGRRPSPKHSIDRIDNNGNYEPGNCRWATTKEQAANTSISRKIEVDGLIFNTIGEFSKHIEMSRKAVEYRLYEKKMSTNEIYEQFKKSKSI